MATFFRKRLGDFLLNAGVISQEQLDLALEEQRLSDKRLGQILLEKGFITADKLIETLEQQLGIPHANLYNLHIDAEAATSIPAHLARRHCVIPIARDNNKLTLAMADPLNVIAVDDVAMLTGAEVEAVFSTERAINHAIDQFFGLKESVDAVTRDSALRPSDKEEAELNRLRAMVEEAPIVKVVNAIIQQAVAEEASDIHIEPMEKGLRVRMRIDGILQELIMPPKDAQPLIISRVKIMAGLDIAERRLPQDGRLQTSIKLKEINIRVSTMPTIFGEKIVLRILDKERIIMPLEKLGFNDYNESIYRRLIGNNAGIVLVAGPTGCGKTTTLYSTINYLNDLEKNIITIEDPVEHRLDGVNQVQVNTRIGLSFASILRTILRQDPNVIMVGEIRDRETAEIATRAALTGHLVFSTLHTNDAPLTVSRLIDMGVEPFLIASSLVGVVAQRLLRLICSHCREEYSLPEDKAALFYGLYSEKGGKSVVRFYRGRGCNRCNQTGYKGRAAVHEVVAVDSGLRKLILNKAGVEEMRETILQKGMITMLSDALNLVTAGATTFEETLRAVYGNSQGG